jgi:hypothetical protein
MTLVVIFGDGRRDPGDAESEGSGRERRRAPSNRASATLKVPAAPPRPGFFKSLHESAKPEISSTEGADKRA